MQSDAIETVFYFLPAMSMLCASVVSKEWHQAAVREYAWQGRVEETLARDPSLSTHLSNEGLSARQTFFVLMAAEEAKHAPLYISEKDRVEDFFARNLYELRRLGDIEGEGTPGAKFIPFDGAVQLPIPRQAVLELSMLLDDVPRGKLGQTTARYIASVVLKGQVSHQAVANTSSCIKGIRRARAHLIAPLLEAEFPQCKEISETLMEVVEATPRERALLERNEFLEMENASLRQQLEQVERAYAEERALAERYRIALWSDGRELTRLRDALAVALSEGEESQEQVHDLKGELVKSLKLYEAATAARNTSRRMLARSRAARQADIEDAQAREERLRARSAVSMASVVAARERDRVVKEKALAQAASIRTEAEEALSSATAASQTDANFLRQMQRKADSHAKELATARALAREREARAEAAMTRAVEAEAVTAAASLEAVRSMQEVKVQLIKDSQAEAAAGNTTEFMGKIAANFLKAQAPGKSFHVGTGKQGPGMQGSRVTKAFKGSADVKDARTLRRRTNEMTRMQVATSVVSLISLISLI